MADRILLLTWGTVVRGREERALEVFNHALGVYGRMEQEGEIDSFDVTLMARNGPVHGYAQLKGTAQQLAAVREDPEFLRLCADAELVVDDFLVSYGYCDEGVAEYLAIYQEAIAEIPQRVAG